MDIDVATKDRVTTAECISCNQCVAACPQKSALEITSFGKKLGPLGVLTLVVGLFFGTIAIAQLTDNFDILPPPIAAGEVIPLAEAKGYFTIEDTATATVLTLEEVYHKLGVPKETQLKKISEISPNYSDEAQAPSDFPKSEKGGIDVSSIKGKMTIQEAATSLNMDLKEFYTLFNIPSDIPSQTQLKNVAEKVPGYNLEEVKAGFQ